MTRKSKGDAKVKGPKKTPEKVTEGATTTQNSKSALGLLPRLSLIFSLVCLLAIGGGLIWRLSSKPNAASSFANLGQEADGITLTDSLGNTMRWGDLTGRPRALFFGFTRCPEICPTTLSELDAAIKLVGPPASKLQVQFVSIDPERDTPESLNSYIAWFEGEARGYSGTPDQIAKLAKSYRVGYRKVPLSNNDYTMDHTALVYLVDSTGQVKDFIVYGSGPERAAGQIRAFLSRTP